MAPSREKANVIRLALVTQAMPQNSWPIVEISSTPLAAAELNAVSRIDTAGKPAVEIVLMSLLWTAKVSASSRIQPIAAEEKTERHTPRAADMLAPWVSSETCADAS